MHVGCQVGAGSAQRREEVGLARAGRRRKVGARRLGKAGRRGPETPPEMTVVGHSDAGGHHRSSRRAGQVWHKRHLAMRRIEVPNAARWARALALRKKSKIKNHARFRVGRRVFLALKNQTI
eukprot:2755993-Prymnesium_polylepis.1